MHEFKIDYVIDVHKPYEEVKDRHQFSGGIRVTCNDTVLTKSIGSNDDGYIGNWLYDDILFGLIEGIPLFDGKHEHEIEETFSGFAMEMKDEQIFFSLVSFNMDEEGAEDFIRTYPEGSRGCWIPARIFYAEVIRAGHEFLEEFTSMFENFSKDEIEGYRRSLEKAEKLVEEYNKTH